jgi:acetyl esterase
MMHPDAVRALKWRTSKPIYLGNCIEARANIPTPFPSREIVHEVQDILCDDVKCRFYCPTRPDGHQSMGLTIYIHGGGWVSGNIAMVDHVCRCLANKSGHAVLAIDYRLAPEAPYPAPVDDCFKVVRWVHANALTKLGCDNSRICIMGESAGGNLAAVVVNQSGVPLKLQVLLYPVTDCRVLAGPAASMFLEKGSSYDLYGIDDKYGLSYKDMSWYFQNYVNCEKESHYEQMAALSAISPLLEANDVLCASPPTLILTAECDVLRNDGEAYAEKLDKLGVDVTVVDYPGQIHGFFLYQLSMSDAREALNRIADAIKQALLDPST